MLYMSIQRFNPQAAPETCRATHRPFTDFGGGHLLPLFAELRESLEKPST